MPAGHAFISHASADAAIAASVCAALEQRGLKCWMAPRDVPPGGEYAQALVAAIKSSRGIVVIFSVHANDSPHVLREVERAVTHRIPVVPLRLGGAQPSGSMEYLLSTPHWLEAPARPTEDSFDALAAALRGAPSAPQGGRSSRPLGLLGAAVLQGAVALHGLFVGLTLLSIMAAPAKQREGAIVLLPYGASGVVIGAALLAGATGLLFRQKWAHRSSLALNLVNVPFQLLWGSAAFEVARSQGAGSPSFAPVQLFAVLISLALAVYLFQPRVSRHFSASGA